MAAAPLMVWGETPAAPQPSTDAIQAGMAAALAQQRASVSEAGEFGNGPGPYAGGLVFHRSVGGIPGLFQFAALRSAARADSDG